MSDFWQRALLYPLIALLTSLLLWAIAGPLPAALLFGLLLLARHLFHLHYLSQLERWAEAPERLPVPEGDGVWEDAFSHLNKMVKTHRQEREQHAAALRQIEQATAALPEGVVILDAACHIEWCNPLAEQHFGLDGRRDLKQQITYLARQPEFVHYLERADFREPLVLRGTRQEDLVLSIKVVPYGDNQKLLISRDVTQLERLETMRRDFVANVSHELRTPLTVVNGFIETLSDMPELENDMTRRALAMMAEQTGRMATLVQDLLTLSRLESSSNQLQETEVDVPALLQRVLEEGQALSAGRHTLHISECCSARLLANESELHSAFGNLVSNAVRYTPAGGEIVLAWMLGSDGRARFSVTDNGIGIPAQHIPRLTERFYRVDLSRSRETGGTGLGLAIVKHIVNRHQAELEIESSEGQGSTFRIVFPARRVITG